MKVEEERAKDVRDQVPWNLQTPFAPGVSQPGPICRSMQENQLEQINWAYSNRMMFVGTLPGLDRIHFGDLLALVNAASLSSTGTQRASYGMDSSALGNSPSDSCRLESSSGILNAGFSLGLHSWDAGERVEENPQYGKTDELPTSRQYLYDLNLPPEEMMNMNPQTTAAEFAPITPGKPTRTFPERQDSRTARKTDQEHRQPVKDSLLVAHSTVRKKNKKTQREIQDIEHIKTPQQKPRRKKHRPKVVIEGKPKQPSKLEISKSAEPKRKKSGKRKNVKRKVDDVELMPLSVEAAEASGLKSYSLPKRSTRRALNFNYDTEEEDSFMLLSTSDCSKLQVREKVCIHAANDFTRKNHTSGGHGAPHTPMPIFSNIPKRRRRSTPSNRFNNDRKMDQSLGDNDHKYKPKVLLQFGYEDATPMSEGRLLESAKGKNPTADDQVDTRRDSLQIQCNSLHMFRPFPGIRKKRRTDGSSFVMPSTSTEKDRVQRETLSQHNPYMEPSEECVPNTSQWSTGLTCPNKLRRKRSRTITRARNFNSLKRILEACDQQRYWAPHKPQILEAIISKMQLTMPRKKRTKRNSILSRFSARRLQMQWGFYLQHHLPLSAKLKGTSPDDLWKQLIPIDEISEWFKQLDINRESPYTSDHRQTALIPHRTRYREQNALVLYRRDGTIIPLEKSSYSLKKQRPRPMVKLDDETTRVWKLLMADINSKGIDGTDDEKEKWWEEERRVFCGRADSFIARMRLVQGDRRFSPWMGSVVDSVIGVFLTQNVSDHLSSSAFMAMAAQFPLKSNSNKRPCHEQWGSSVTHDPLMYLEDLGDAVSAPPICNPSCIIIHDEDNNAACTDETSRSCGSFNSSLKVLDAYSISEANKIRYHVGERNEALQPSWDSPLSQDLENVRPAINANKTGSYLLSKMEKEYSSDGSRLNSLDAPFTELLELAQGTMQQRHGSSNTFLDAISVNKHSNFEMLEGDSHIPYIDDSTDSRMSQETSTISSSPLTDAVSQPRSSSQQENIILHAQDNREENRNMEQLINTENPSRDILDMTESNSSLQNHLNTPNETSESNKDHIYKSRVSNKMKASSSKSKGGKARRRKNEGNLDWDGLRRQAESSGPKRERRGGMMDSVDWEAVRCADVDKIAKTIRARGMNNMLSERIKDFLNRLVEEQGSIDLEWLRDIPPDKAKEYLLSIRGLGLKSVECVRLLTLHHLAFPVDTNVGRIAVRLGWVPLQPLPESLQLHLLELYPVLESIQKYLWPRLCKLDQKTLYELHYQMITFGKVFCTKSKPNCNACPLRGECRHFASAFASARLALPGPEEKSIVKTEERTKPEPVVVNFQQSLSLPQELKQSQQLQATEAPNSEPKNEAKIYEPIIEEPVTPEPECTQVPENDIEDVFCEDTDEIPTIKLNMEAFTHNLQNYMQINMELQEADVSKALVALRTETSIPMPRLKNVSRLRTEHQVYELPDSHPLLEGLDKREPDDPCTYLLAIWTPGEMANSIQPPEKRCVSEEDGSLCHRKTCFSCNNIREAESQIVRGTLLIPCRTAMRGSFPLNGTYFQVNEVFADHDSSLNPIDVPRDWIWNLPRRTVHFGTSIPTIFRGLTTEAIQHCFWRGYVCVRGFDRKTRAPRPLVARLHFPASKLGKRKGRTNQDET